MAQRPLPPLNALRAFEATARHLSFTKAAAELHVTPAALSHQIRGLEELLGLELFVRKTRAIELTPAARRIQPGIQAGFESLRQAMAHLRSLEDDRILVISAPPGFTAKWLAPRLYRFQMANGDIDARVSSSGSLANFTSDGVDVAIRSLGAPPADLAFVKLMDDGVLPVASPRLLAGRTFASPLELLELPLIHDESIMSVRGVPGWRDWLAAAGIVVAAAPERGLRFSSADHAIDACVEGAGVVLARASLVQDDIRTGRLVAPFALILPANRAFYLVYTAASERAPKVVAFRTWITAEAQRFVAAAAPAG